MTGTVYKVNELIENRYRVLSVLETGGMGVLYRVADETKDGQMIALKTIKVDVPGMESPESAAHFQREFQILTRLRHPNLVSVYDYGITTRDDLYFTMEWAQGHPLGHWQSSLKPGTITPLIIQICRALAYLHARGVIHGDLKPGNVLMADGQVKLVDFGVALEMRSVEARAHYYTPGYTAPEVKLQRPVDQRMDLYSLGALWYAMLIGEPPMFADGSDRLILFSLSEALETQAEIPVEISAVVARLLATSPANRYGSANEVIEAINRVTGSQYTLETRETASSYALRTHFVDRETEFGILWNLWQRAQAGEGQLVLMSGEAGVGKTRMIEEFEVRAELEGTHVVWGQCVESEGVAYRPWREVLRVLTRYVESGNRQVMQRTGPVLAALLPELWERPSMAGLGQPAELDPRAAQQRLNDAVVQVLRAAAEMRPTVMVIEDAHWADEATLALLTLLARIPKPANLLVCLTYRDSDVDAQHPLTVLRNSGIECFGVRTLPPEFTTDLARLMLGLNALPPLLMERVQQVTGGNAFFTQELIRTLAEDGVVLQRTVEGWRVDEAALQQVNLPVGIRQVVEQRLARLAVEARQALSWAAMMGMVSWESGMAEAGQVARAQVRTALREVVQQGLIVERDESAFLGEREYLFNSSTVREVSYESIPADRRQGYHTRLAAWLMARSDEQINEHLGLIADHLEKAGQIEQAVTYLHRAGEQAASQYANAEAIHYLSHALDLAPADDHAKRYALLLAREKVYALQGQLDSQAQDIAMLEELANLLDDGSQQASARRVDVALRRAGYDDTTGDYPRIIASAMGMLRLSQATQDVQQQAWGHLWWGRALWRQGNFADSRAQLEQALALAQKAGGRQVNADCLHNLGIVALDQGDYTQAKIYYEQLIDIYRELGDRVGESKVYNNLGILYWNLGDFSTAKSFYEKSVLINREIGYRSMEGLALGNMGNVFESLGDYAEARNCHQQALAISHGAGDRLDAARSMCNLGLIYHYLGENKTALEYIDQSLSTAQELGARRLQGSALTYRGHTLAGLGRLDEAATAYEQAMEVRHGLGTPSRTIEARAGLVSVLLAQEKLSQAQTHVEEILAYLQQGTLDGADNPIQIYLTCYRVLCVNADPRAKAILEIAHRSLEEKAARISDKSMRRSFLENVAAHREIVRAYTERQDKLSEPYG